MRKSCKLSGPDKGKSLTVEMGTGADKRVIPFEYDVAETVGEFEAAFSSAWAKGLLPQGLTIVEVFDYGLGLKIRAKIQAANTPKGMVKVHRAWTQAWCLSPAGAGRGFRDPLMEILVSGAGDTVRNEYLDGVREDEEVWALVREFNGQK